MRATRDEIVVSERQIEDILATYTDLLAELLGAPTPLRVLARQMELPNGGRLDLLCLAGGQLHLVELKVEPARRQFIEQVENYSEQVSLLQKRGILPAGSLQAYLLSPRVPSNLTPFFASRAVHAIEYAPEQLLRRFFEGFQHRLAFVNLAPHNHGVWHLGVTNPIVETLSAKGAMGDDALARDTGLAVSTVRSYLTLLEQLGIVRREDSTYHLTVLGTEYAQAAEPSSRQITEVQATLLRSFILRNPFASGVSLGIFTVVENAITAAKNHYPVPLDLLSDYFTISVGNQNRWNKPKTRRDATRMYVEYAAQLGLLARIGEFVYPTPEGIRFNLMLQMHKAIQLVEPLHLKQL